VARNPSLRAHARTRPRSLQQFPGEIMLDDIGAPTRALDLDRFEFLILNDEVLALGYLVAISLLARLNSPVMPKKLAD
jgi:hypothetical protein